MLFSHPAFLWGLLAVAVPVVIHLFNFRRYRKVYFSNVERLSELHTEQRRRSTLRQWLLLAMRVLAVVFLVLAFAQPVIPTEGNIPRTGSTVVSLYVDNSFSMANASSDGSLLDAARQKVREIADAYSASDRFQLITNDMKGSEMRWLNRDELFEALDEVTSLDGSRGASPASPLMSTVAERQVDFMRQAGTRNRHAYIISDFQRSTADLDRLFAVTEADSSLLVTLVPLSAVEADNLYVDSLLLDAPAYYVGGSVAVEVSLGNSGSRDVEKVPVKLTVDGRERAVTTVDIPAGGTTRTTLVFRLDHTGWTDGCLTIEDYPVTFDDCYHFTLCVGDRLRVLHLNLTEDRLQQESINRLFAPDSTVDYQRAARLQHDLAQYHFVILDQPRGLASGEVQQLAQWVLDGGSLLVVPSADGGAALNDLLQAVQAPRLERWVQRAVKASTIDYSSSLYRGVFSGHNDEMEMPSVQGHYTLAAGIKQSIITLADGGDLLCVTPAGAGKLYLFTTPLTAGQTDFANQALFVPTLYNMALYSRPLPPSSYTLGSDEPIMLQGTYDITSTPPELSAPNSDFRILPDLRRIGGSQQLVLHGELTHDGIYRLGEEHLAFNYSRRESQMSFLDRREIAKAIDGHEGLTLVRNSTKPLTDQLRARDGGRPLWRLCILLALVALAVETILLKLNTNH